MHNVHAYNFMRAVLHLVPAQQNVGHSQQQPLTQNACISNMERSLCLVVQQGTGACLGAALTDTAKDIPILVHICCIMKCYNVH